MRVHRRLAPAASDVPAPGHDGKGDGLRLSHGRFSVRRAGAYSLVEDFYSEARTRARGMADAPPAARTRCERSENTDRTAALSLARAAHLVQSFAP